MQQNGASPQNRKKNFYGPRNAEERCVERTKEEDCKNEEEIIDTVRK